MSLKKRAVNYWQNESFGHPLTCNNGCGNLVYKSGKLFCRKCSYTQEIPEMIINRYKDAVSKRWYYITPFFRWYDLWIGLYIDSKNHAIYICPIPMIGIKIGFQYPNPLGEIFERALKQNKR